MFAHDYMATALDAAQRTPDGGERRCQKAADPVDATAGAMCRAVGEACQVGADCCSGRCE
jgi:hypothetical protein